MRTFLALSIAMVFAVAPAAAQQSPCLRFGEIYSWKATDNRTLIVEDNLHQKFKLSLMGYCPNVTFKERVGFRSRGATQLTCMTAGDDVIVNNLGAGSQNCPIRSVEAYMPATQKADEATAAAKTNPGP